MIFNIIFRFGVQQEIDRQYVVVTCQ